MPSYVVAGADEVPPGERILVEVQGRSIGIFNIRGEFFALRNACPHQGAPLCLGSLDGTAAPSAPGVYEWVRDGEILACPWHGWEFDVRTGRSIFNPHRTRVRSYEVTVEEPETPDPSVETYPLSVEAGRLVLHM
jgi:nitrite reductase/ring-hydroxylating ferredoxin subunit